MTLRLVAAVVLALMPASEAVAMPQGSLVSPPVVGSPPVLSTVPDPPAGAKAEPAQMSGVPLQVGDLPPGIVAVRVIRRSFQDNVSGQVVRLRIDDGDRILAAVTGVDGRAQFDGLLVGESIQVRAAVGNENLESQQFQVPAQGGVRLVLVAGVGAATATSADWPEGFGDGAVPAPARTSAASSGRATASSAPSPRTGLWLAVATVLACVIVAWLELRRRPPKPEAPVPEVDVVAPAYREPPEERAAMFEQLVRLEKDYEAGRVSEEAHAATRDALIERLAALDAASQRT